MGEFPSMKTANSAGHWFHQIIQLGNQYTPLPGTTLFPQGRGVNDPKPHAFSHRFARAEEAALGVSFNAQPRRQTSLAFRLALQFRNTQLPYRPNPRPRTSLCCRCARLWKSSWLPSTPKLKLPTIRLTSRAPSVPRVIGSHHHPLSAKCSKDCLYGFPLNPVKCHLTFHPVLIRYQFAPKPQDHRLIRERSFMIIRGRFNRHMMR